MNVLVTGGAGFIGSHTVDLLIEEGYNVVVVDNFATGYKDNINPKARFYKIDITSPLLKNIFKKEKIDFVIHLAAQINVRTSVSNPVFDGNSNVLGSINLLECCKKFNVKKIVYSSSGGAVYGEPEYLPCDEVHPVKPICPYGISKHTVEHYLFLYDLLYNIDYVSLRYSNVYGPRQDPRGEAGVISIFLDKITKKKIPIINGDGNQTRDFVYVEDVAKANLLALEKTSDEKVFNIGTNKEISVNQIYKLIKKNLNIDVNPKHGPSIPGEVYRIRLDNSLAKRKIGWKPKYDFERGLKKTISWFREDKSLV